LRKGGIGSCRGKWKMIGEGKKNGGCGPAVHAEDLGLGLQRIEEVGGQTFGEESGLNNEGHPSLCSF
jgi:hypothetical protein